MADEFHERPWGGFGGVVGEFASPPPLSQRPPPQPLPQPFVVPPWDGSSFVEPEQPEPDPPPRAEIPAPPWKSDNEEDER
jgi:hypothetical protein